MKPKISLVFKYLFYVWTLFKIKCHTVGVCCIKFWIYQPSQTVILECWQKRKSHKKVIQNTVKHVPWCVCKISSIQKLRGEGGKHPIDLKSNKYCDAENDTRRQNLLTCTDRYLGLFRKAKAQAWISSSILLFTLSWVVVFTNSRSCSMYTFVPTSSWIMLPQFFTHDSNTWSLTWYQLRLYVSIHCIWLRSYVCNTL